MLDRDEDCAIISRPEREEEERILARTMLMDSEHLRAGAARDQLWASLRALLPEIDRLGNGTFEGTERERQIIQLLARIVSAELGFRAEEARG
jgi:hypothetical protein